MNLLETMTKKDVGRTLLRALAVGIVFVLLMFEYVNFETTYIALRAMFGPVAWIDILAAAVVLLDVLALARVLTPEVDGAKEPLHVKTLLGLWVIVTFFDAFLTWYTLQLQMEQIVVQAPIVVADLVPSVMSVAVSVMVWAVGAMLLYLLGLMLDHLLHPKPATPQRTPATPQRTLESLRHPAQPPWQAPSPNQSP